MKFGFYSSILDPNLTRLYSDQLDELREQVVLCEEAGFDIAWADEHHFNIGMVNSPNAIVPGAMLADATSRIRIGLPVPLNNWNPLRLAEDVAVLDHLSKGRVEVDMGRGSSAFDVANLNPQLSGLWPGPETRFEPNAQVDSREHFAEVVDILRKAWTEEFFSHEGRFYQFPQPGFPWASSILPNDPTAVKDGQIVKMTVGPKPYQKPYPPLRMLMSSEPSFTEAAELGLLGWVWIQPPKRLRQRLEIYSDIRNKREGRQLRVGEDVGAMRMTFVAPSYEEAKRDADQFFTPAIERACRRRPQSYYSDEGGEVAGGIDLNWEFFREQLLIIAGTPEQVTEQIQELDEICGLDFIALWMESGGISHKKIMSSIDLFSEKVLPNFADGK